MEEKRDFFNKGDKGSRDALNRPFDSVEMSAQTALICEPDNKIRGKISNALKKLGYRITEVSSAAEAFKNIRFHMYDVVAVNEIADPSTPERNDVLAYLEMLSMAVRRRIFVALISGKHRTMDNMSAFNKSVNVIINIENIDDAEAIFRDAIAENNAFYSVFMDVLRKMGRI